MKKKLIVASIAIVSFSIYFFFIKKAPPPVGQKPPASSGQFMTNKEKNKPMPFPPEVLKKMQSIVEPKDKELKREKKGNIPSVKTLDLYWKYRSGDKVYFRFDVNTKASSITDFDGKETLSSNCTFKEDLLKDLVGKINDTEKCLFDYYPDKPEVCAPVDIPAEIIINRFETSEVKLGERKDHCQSDLHVCGMVARANIKISIRELISSVECH